jgi:hypothetical protein
MFLKLGFTATNGVFLLPENLAFLELGDTMVTRSDLRQHSKKSCLSFAATIKI